WNEDEQRYWMLITSRYNNQAAIGLYTSTDLASWTAQPPLYAETSPLNLEVPEYFEFADTPFVVYSDQRNESPVVKYLIKQNNQWVKPNLDALDGRYFYAARSAGPESERLLFGWVPHTDGRNDGAAAQWGGDLIMHQLHKKPNGELAVKFPKKLRQQMSQQMPVENLQANKGVRSFNKGRFANSALLVLPKGQFLLPAASNKNLLELAVVSKNTNAKLAVALNSDKHSVQYKILLNSAQNKAMLLQQINGNKNVIAEVEVQLDPKKDIQLQLYSDPQSGVGSLYINQDKALSFRLYQLKDYQIGLEAIKGMFEVKDMNRIGL
ncbi:hypothetical protein ABS311_15345, partial [Catenovulum sediminis]